MPLGFGRWGNMCYRYVAREMTFSQAAEYCKDLRGICNRGDGHLLPTRVAEENNAGLKAYKDACIKSAVDSFWIGYKDSKSEGKWESVSSLARSYRYYNWASGNGGNSGSKDCAAMRPDGKWIADDCGKKKPFICRIIRTNH
ncbi:perlucin-like [Diadema setosum]|uniref:perlucin-like n=1 Tax=Diadema setosum TaxID=31175 RepID=UPI003B3A2AF1